MGKHEDDSDGTKKNPDPSKWVKPANAPAKDDGKHGKKDGK